MYVFAEGSSKTQRCNEQRSPNNVADVLESGAINVEQIKACLEHVILARKPPGLLNIPSTPPLFHMVSRESVFTAF